MPHRHNKSAKVDADTFEHLFHALSERVQSLETTVTKLEQRMECKTAGDANSTRASHDTEATPCLEERVRRIETLLFNIPDIKELDAAIANLIRVQSNMVGKPLSFFPTSAPPGDTSPTSSPGAPSARRNLDFSSPAEAATCGVSTTTLSSATVITTKSSSSQPEASMFRFHVDRDDGVWVPLSASNARRGAFARCIGEAWTQSGRDEGALDVLFRAGDLIRINFLDDDGDASVEALTEAGVAELWASMPTSLWLLREQFAAFEVWQPLSAVSAAAACLRDARRTACDGASWAP